MQCRAYIRKCRVCVSEGKERYLSLTFYTLSLSHTYYTYTHRNHPKLHHFSPLNIRRRITTRKKEKNQAISFVCSFHSSSLFFIHIFPPFLFLFISIQYPYQANSNMLHFLLHIFGFVRCIQISETYHTLGCIVHIHSFTLDFVNLNVEISLNFNFVFERHVNILYQILISSKEKLFE